MKSVTIIGAGTIGLHCAYYLHQSGHQVTIIESLPENNTTSCSFGNCGFIVPSHFVPVASPSMLKSGLKLLFNSSGPVSIPLQKNIGQLKWFLQFMQASKQSKVRKSASILYWLNHQSHLLYEELSSNYKLENEFHSDGLLMIAQTQKKLEEEIELTKLATELNIPTKILSPSELNDLEPAAQIEAKGAILYESDGYINPGKHVSWLKSYLKQEGVNFYYNHEICDVKHTNKRITEISTTKENFKSDEFILAAGVFSRKLAQKLNLNCPVISGKGYSMDFPRTYAPINHPIILTEAMVAMSPFKDNTRLGSGMEFNAIPGTPNFKRIQTMLDKTSETIHSFPRLQASKQKLWEGMRPVTPDGLPIIGRPQDYDNLAIATGHAMMGSSLGPITGKLITAIINQEKVEINMDQIHPDRFN